MLALLPLSGTEMSFLGVLAHGLIVQDPNAVRGKWTIGRVINVYPGKDGRVRNVKLKTPTTEYQRPITKIVVIYPAEGHED